MSEKRSPTTAAARYDKALRRGQALSPVPAGCPVPQPTAVWPAENVALLERYRAWLEEGGAAAAVIAQHRLPMAGHVLGLTRKPHSQLDLAVDLPKAMAYIEAKGRSASWTNNCRYSLRWFHRFLCRERGVATATPGAADGNAGRYKAGLPDWLLAQLEQYLHLRQPNWRPARLAQATYHYWYKHTRLWRWLFARYPIAEAADVKREHLFAYMDAMLTAGYAPSSVNGDLFTFQATLRFLGGRGFQAPQALLNVSGLKVPDTLPRFLSDAQVVRLRDELERGVKTAGTPAKRRDALLDRAAFYLLWQAGLRVGEVEEVTLADLNLGGRRLLVRQGKGRKDRAVYLTDAAAAAVEAYREARGARDSDHLFLYRHRPLCRDLLRRRMKTAGERVGVKVSPHMLRHTFATQLVNAGCRVTTIQALLGHRRLNSTMVYARVHDRTVAGDYYTAMAVIEERLQSPLDAPADRSPDNEDHRPPSTEEVNHLLALATALQVVPLPARQQTLATELQQGLAALAESLNGAPKQGGRVVNEPVEQPPERLPVP